MTVQAVTAQPFDDDDIAVWPNGTWADLGDVREGHYNYMSDDYEIVRFDNTARLIELGVIDKADLSST